MDPFRHPFTNNNNNNSRYVPIPSPRFPDADPIRYPVFHPPPEHHHHHGPPPPPPPPHHHYNAHDSNHNNLFLPSSSYPSPHPPYNPPILSPRPLIFPHPSPRVPDRDHHLQFAFRENDPNRSSPLVWEEGSFARPSFAIDRDFDHRGIRLPLPEAADRGLVRRKRFNSESEGPEWREFEEDHIGDFWGRRDPHNHPRSHNQRRLVRRKTLASRPFDDLDSMTVMLGPHGHSSGERGSRKRNPFDGVTVHERISGGGGAVEAVDEDGMWIREPSSMGFFSQSGKDEEEVVRGDNGIRLGSGKHMTPVKTGKGKRTMPHENKPQKKISALLRIQNGNNVNRKRNDEQLHQSSHFGDSNAAASKGKGPSVFSDHRLEKVSSPVELDVSFKSNALVAKAIFPSGDRSMGPNKKGLVKIKKKKKKVVGSVSHLPSSQGARINNKDTMSNSHIPMQASEKVRVSKAGPVAGDAATPASKFCSPIVKIAVPAVHSVKENSKSTHVSFVEDVTDRLDSNVMDIAEISKDLATPNTESPPSGAKGDMQDANPTETATDCEEVSAEVGDKEGKLQRTEQAEVGDMEEHQMGCSKKCQDAFELHSEAKEEMDTLPSEVQVLSANIMEGDGCNEMVEGLHKSDHTLMEAEVPLISTNNSTEEGIVHLLDRSSRIDSPESLSAVPEVDSLNEDQSFWRKPDENGSMDNNRKDEETAIRDDFSMIGNDPSVKSKVNGKTNERLLKYNHMIIEKKLSSQSLTTKSATTDVKSAPEVLNCKTTAHQSSRISGSLPPRANFASRPVKEMISSTRTGRPRTWRRTDSSSASPSPVHESGLSFGPTERQLQKKAVKVQTPSYIRKGNSLVRKSTPVSSFRGASPGSGTLIYPSNSKSEDTSKRFMVSKRNVDTTDCTSGGTNPSFERPKTPPIPHTSKSLNCMSKNSLGSFNSTSVDPLAQAGLEISAYTTLDPIKPSSSKVFPGRARTPENQAPESVMSNLGTQSQLNDGKLKSPKAKRMIYVKCKSNQLVAAPRTEIRDSAIPNTEKTSAVYFKRRKNQLVRNNASLKVQVKQVIPIPDDGSNSEGQSAPEISTAKCNRSLSKKILDRVLEKSCKSSKSSLVWTLSGSQSHNKDTDFLQCQRVLPFLFPWKRTTDRRCSIRNIAFASNMNPLSPIRKLKLSRQRDTVYTRSTNGFSLRKSRVLSIGGSNLKWSKSIERRSKKANEEATLAVAAAERKKREQKRAASTAKTKHGNPSTRRSAHGIELQPGERIFRVGSVRYKMDSSKRTLVRIPDEKPSSAVNLQSDEKTRISFVPRRLLIGNNEYIRIGNGNQLVRDPKKLTRILANEKIRWSLHTARLRLAKKQQYCQFFTRFGKCNKDGGKCPYIHDPAKVAVCTKFLKGRCSSSNCKLTHKVIPERMPDCSYFLQGLCTNENCPYRHVNVNPNASVCEGFLRGYCADGDECRRKHSYVCPVFEANGVCPQGSACKLHHPKTGNKSKKRKRSKDERNFRSRYFGSLGFINAGVSKANASDDHSPEQRGDIFFCDGRYTDYISLDFVDAAVGETDHKMSTDAALSGGEPSDNRDALIEPFHFITTSRHDERASIC